MNNLKTNEARQSTNIPTKLIKGNSDTFGNFIFETLTTSFSA